MGKQKKISSKNSGITGGAILILLGALLLLRSYGIIHFGASHFVLLIGIAFMISFILSKNPGLLIPGVMISIFGLILILNLAFLPYLWTLGVCASFFAVYLTKKEDTKWALIPGSIFLLMSIIIMLNYYFSQINLFPLILIGLGAYLIYKNFSGRKK
jgi:hypothetical protein